MLSLMTSRSILPVVRNVPAIRTALHVPAVRMVADPFLDPVFNAADSAEPASSTFESIAGNAPGLGPSQLMYMFMWYIIFMGLLEAWDAFVLPKLQAKGLLPYDDLHPRPPSEPARWVTMLTMDRNLRVPSLQELMEACHMIGSTDDEHVQYLCVEGTEGDEAFSKRWFEGSQTTAGPVCTLANDFTTHYGVNVYVCSKPSRRQ